MTSDNPIVLTLSKFAWTNNREDSISVTETKKKTVHVQSVVFQPSSTPLTWFKNSVQRWWLDPVANWPHQ